MIAALAPRSRAALFCLALVPLLAGLLWPLLLFDQPQMQDYPNHLARAYILLHPRDPALAGHYRIVWSSIPDLAWDYWAVTIGRLVALPLAGKLFVALAFSLEVTGCFALGRAITGRWSALPLLAVPFLFHAGYAKGFLNFDFGIGVFLWASAAWAGMPPRRWLVRLLLGTVLATLLYASHLFCWALYGLFVLGWETRRALESKAGTPATVLALARDGLQAVPALLLYALAAQSAEPVHAPQLYPLYDAFSERLGDLSLLIDTGLPTLNATLIALCCVVPLLGLRLGMLRFERRALYPVLFCAGLFFVVPDHMLGGDYVAWRAMLAAILLALCSLAPGPAAQRLPWLLACSLAAALFVPLWSAPSWRRSETEVQELRTLIAPLPAGAKIFWAHIGLSNADVVARDPGTFHADAYAVIDRQALVQNLFVYPGQQPLRFRDLALQAAPKNSDTMLYLMVRHYQMAHQGLSAQILRFDYVLLHGPDDALAKAVLPFDRMRLMAARGDLRLYRIVR